MRKSNIEFLSCDSGLGSSVDVDSTYEYDVQDIPLTMCNIGVGLEERLENLNENFDDFSKKLEAAESKFRACGAKLEEIHIVLDKFANELHLIAETRKISLSLRFRR